MSAKGCSVFVQGAEIIYEYIQVSWKNMAAIGQWNLSRCQSRLTEADRNESCWACLSVWEIQEKLATRDTLFQSELPINMFIYTTHNIFYVMIYVSIVLKCTLSNKKTKVIIKMSFKFWSFCLFLTDGIPWLKRPVVSGLFIKQEAANY